MGRLTDFEIASWQEAAGIEPASGDRARTLDDLSKAAFEAIKIIELERSGIRDGDGRWRGSDVIDAMTRDLIRLCQCLITIDHIDNDEGPSFGLAPWAKALIDKDEPATEPEPPAPWPDGENPF